MLKWLFSPADDHPYNKATKLFKELRYLYSNNERYLSNLTGIIYLCQSAIQENKFDGDSHVLLSNAYLLASLDCIYRPGHFYFLARSAATIYVTKLDNINIKERLIAERLVQSVTQQLANPIPQFLVGDLVPITQNLERLYQDYYYDSIYNTKEDDIRRMLKAE